MGNQRVSTDIDGLKKPLSDSKAAFFVQWFAKYDCFIVPVVLQDIASVFYLSKYY